MARGNPDTTGRQDRSENPNLDDPTREREGDESGPDTANDAGVGADEDDDDFLETDEDDDEAEDEEEGVS